MSQDSNKDMPKTNNKAFQSAVKTFQDKINEAAQRQKEEEEKKHRALKAKKEAKALKDKEDIEKAKKDREEQALIRKNQEEREEEEKRENDKYLGIQAGSVNRLKEEFESRAKKKNTPTPIKPEKKHKTVVSEKISKLQKELGLVKTQSSSSRNHAPQISKSAIKPSTSTSLSDKDISAAATIEGTNKRISRIQAKIEQHVPPKLTNLEQLHKEVKEHPADLAKKKAESAEFSKNVKAMQNLAKLVAKDEEPLIDAPSFSKTGKENIWKVPEHLPGVSDAPVFMSRFDSKGNIVKDDKTGEQIYDVLYYDNNGKLDLNKSFIAPDTENSKSSVHPETRTKYIQVQETLNQKQLKEAGKALGTQNHDKKNAAQVTPNTGQGKSQERQNLL